MCQTAGDLGVSSGSWPRPDSRTEGRVDHGHLLQGGPAQPHFKPSSLTLLKGMSSSFWLLCYLVTVEAQCHPKSSPLC